MLAQTRKRFLDFLTRQRYQIFHHANHPRRNINPKTPINRMWKCPLQLVRRMETQKILQDYTRKRPQHSSRSYSQSICCHLNSHRTRRWRKCFSTSASKCSWKSILGKVVSSSLFTDRSFLLYSCCRLIFQSHLLSVAVVSLNCSPLVFLYPTRIAQSSPPAVTTPA